MANVNSTPKTDGSSTQDSPVKTQTDQSKSKPDQNMSTSPIKSQDVQSKSKLDQIKNGYDLSSPELSITPDKSLRNSSTSSKGSKGRV